MTEPRPVLIAPPSPRTPSPQPVVEFPEDEVYTSTYTQYCFACFNMLHANTGEIDVTFLMLLFHLSSKLLYFYLYILHIVIEFKSSRELTSRVKG